MADPFAPQPLTLAPQMFSPAGGVDSQNPLLDLLRALGVVQQQQNAGNVQLAQQQGANQQATARMQRATAQDALFGQDLSARYGTPVNRETGVDSGDPFANGFFLDPAARQAKIESRQRVMPNVESLNFNPYFQAGELARNTPNVSVDAPLPFTQILNEPIAPPALDGGASAQDRTARALRARRNPFSIF